MKNQNIGIFDRCYNDIKSSLSIYSCNLITNLRNAVVDFKNISLLKNENNRYNVNFINSKIDVLKRKFLGNKYKVLYNEFLCVLEQQNRVMEKIRMKRYLESKDVNVLNYHLIKLYSALNFDLNFEGFSPSCIQSIFDEVYFNVVRGTFKDNYKVEFVKGL